MNVVITINVCVGGLYPAQSYRLPYTVHTRRIRSSQGSLYHSRILHHVGCSRPGSGHTSHSHPEYVRDLGVTGKLLIVYTGNALYTQTSFKISVYLVTLTVNMNVVEASGKGRTS